MSEVDSAGGHRHCGARAASRSVLLTVWSILALSLPASVLVGQETPSSAARSALRVGRLTGEVRLDGRLDDPAWATADSIATLTQTEPSEGAAPSGRTVVRVLADGAGLVFGIRADDAEPMRITSFARARDADLSSEDHLKLVLDTYLDGRSGFVFAVNPNGARYDALVVNQGEGENANWDGVWEAATARTPNGWSAEIRIPARSLLFRRGLTEWAFNLQRRVQRMQETEVDTRRTNLTRFPLVFPEKRTFFLEGSDIFDFGLGTADDMRPFFSRRIGLLGGIQVPVDVGFKMNGREGGTSYGALAVRTGDVRELTGTLLSTEGAGRSLGGSLA